MKKHQWWQEKSVTRGKGSLAIKPNRKHLKGNTQLCNTPSVIFLSPLLNPAPLPPCNCLPGFLLLPQCALFIPFLIEAAMGVWVQGCVCSSTQELSVLTSYFHLKFKNRKSEPTHFKITLLPDFLIFFFI